MDYINELEIASDNVTKVTNKTGGSVPKTEQTLRFLDYKYLQDHNTLIWS